jgi:protein TonB
MRPASYTHATYQARPSWRSRLASSVIALAIVALIILVLLRLGGISFEPPGDGRALSTFDVAPPGPKAAPAQRQAERAKTTPRRAQPPRAAPPPPALPPPPIELPGVLKLSREDFASSNIGRFPKAAAEPGEATELAGADAGGGSAGGGGGGPNGERLYNAEWVREPTRAEMVTYMPRRAQTGWGMVACRTIERNRVEDCREIGESPGSGIARGLRQASWQFLVRPPRVNGRPLIGAWVRIKFDLVVGVAR